jgi:hypothetical protein
LVDRECGDHSAAVGNGFKAFSLALRYVHTFSR